MESSLKLMTLLDNLYKGKEFDLDINNLCSKGNISNILLTKAATRKFFKNKGYIFKNNEITIFNNKNIWIKLNCSGEEKFKKFEKQYPEYFI
jgi:preprotein translocase subunit SecA